MKRLTLKIILIAEAVILLLLMLLGVFSQFGYIDVITFPFAQIADILRYLSLSSNLGNIVALILYALICLMPMVIAAIRFRKNSLFKGDLLLPIVSILLFVTLYVLINPYEMGHIFTPVGLETEGGMLLTSIVYITLLGYLVLWMIQLFTESPTNRLLKYLSLTLSMVAILMVAVLCIKLPWDIRSSMQQLRDTNTMFGISFWETDIIIILRAITFALPLVLEIWILFKSLKLIEALTDERYSAEVVMTAKSIEQACRKTIVVTTISTIAFNLIQLAMMKHLINSHVSLEIPLVSIAILLVVMLIARYFSDSQQLKEENDLFV